FHNLLQNEGTKLTVAASIDCAAAGDEPELTCLCSGRCASDRVAPSFSLQSESRYANCAWLARCRGDGPWFFDHGSCRGAVHGVGAGPASARGAATGVGIAAKTQ